MGSSSTFPNPTNQSITVTNQGITPLTIYGVAATTAGQTGSSDFNVSFPCYANCQSGPFPIELLPNGTYTFTVTFTPSQAGARTGTVTISDSSFGGSQAVAVTGVGVYTPPALSINPSRMVFPSQPVGDPSAPQTFIIENTGNGAIVIDRAVASGDFEINPTGSTCEGATIGSCTLAVSFTPTGVGNRYGVLKVIDSLGNPQTFGLVGTGVQATGSLTPSSSSLTFGGQASGSTSPSQQVTLSNTGNAPVTVNSITASGDFSVALQQYDSNRNCPGVLSPSTSCTFQVSFTPTKASGAESGTVTIKSTGGTASIALSGTSLASDQALGFLPSTLNFATTKKGATAGMFGEYDVYLLNTGNEPITFTAAPVFKGTSPTPSADFAFVSDTTCDAYVPNPNFTTQPFPPGSSCEFKVTFTPSLTSSENATLTFVDTAGTQSIALTGSGAATAPAVTVTPATAAFTPIPVGDTAFFGNYGNGSYVTVTLTSTSALKISTAAVTAGSSDFSIPRFDDGCSGDSLSAGASCSVTLAFVPSVAGTRTGVLTFTDGSGKTYTSNLVGYGQPPVASSSLSPSALNFASSPAGAGASLENVSFRVYNSGNLPFTVGTLTTTNISTTPTQSADFAVNLYNDYCYAQVQPGNSCQIGINFQPQSAGVKTGSLSIPITYADNTTTTLAGTVSGTGIAIADSVSLAPSSATFDAVTTGSGSYSYSNAQTFTVMNNGDTFATIGTITGTNLGTSFSSGTGDFYYDSTSCSAYSPLSPGQSCTITVSFSPQTAGLRSGSLSVPVTYADGKTATATTTFSGTGLAPTYFAQVDPLSSQFNAEVVGTTDTTNELTFTLTFTGTGPITVKSVTVSPNFTITNNECQYRQTGECYVVVAFTPLATTAPGFVRGTLTIADNAVGGVQTVALGGTALSVAQSLALSQSTATFGSFPIGTSSSTQTIYLIDRGSSSGPLTQINSIRLGGANPSDFIESENCGGNLGFTLSGREICEFYITFAPGPGPFTTRSATVTITPATGSPLIIQLVGFATAPAKVASLIPAALSFAGLAIDSTSSPQSLQITNVAGRAISLGKVQVTGSTEFTVSTDPCSGTSLAPKATCSVAITFTPTSAGHRIGTAQITDALGRTLQTAHLSGSGVASN